MNATGVKPLQDQVLVRRDPPETQSRGGIHLVSKEWPTIGTVLAAGPWVRDPELAAGARVLFRNRPDSALIPDVREPDQPSRWEHAVMLRAGVDHRGQPVRGTGDILGNVVDE